MVVDLGELYSRNRRGSLGARDGARGVGDGRVSWPIPDGAVDLSLLLHNDAPCGRHWSARFGRLLTDASSSGRLMVIFLFFQRSRLCISDVRPWKGSVELKRAELAAATFTLAVAPLREARTEGRTLVWRPTRSTLTFERVGRKPTSGGDGPDLPRPAESGIIKPRSRSGGGRGARS